VPPSAKTGSVSINSARIFSDNAFSIALSLHVVPSFDPIASLSARRSPFVSPSGVTVTAFALARSCLRCAAGALPFAMFSGDAFAVSPSVMFANSNRSMGI